LIRPSLFCNAPADSFGYGFDIGKREFIRNYRSPTGSAESNCHISKADAYKILKTFTCMPALFNGYYLKSGVNVPYFKRICKEKFNRKALIFAIFNSRKVKKHLN
jgi:hypothetical protein